MSARKYIYLLNKREEKMIVINRDKSEENLPVRDSRRGSLIQDRNLHEIVICRNQSIDFVKPESDHFRRERFRPFLKIHSIVKI